MEKVEILKSFGSKLMYDVRDYCLDQFNNSITKEAHTERKKLFKKNFNQLSPEEQEFVKNIALEMVDSALHYFLWMIEQNEEYDLINYTDNKENFVSLRDISDGLCGELYTEDGWIEKYSKYPPSIE
jgi:hypothetical protein